jgi:molybdenum cofactor cytidylyltransferase
VIAAVVLAAGRSERLGRPKQLLPYRGRTLLRNTIECAIEAECSPIIVVLGARADLIEPTVEGLPGVEVVVHKGWRDGMGTTIRAGMQALRDHAAWADVRAVALLNCDQPLLRPEVLRTMRKKLDDAPESIVACEYGDTVGTPAIFEKSLVGRLEELPPGSGAKPVLEAKRETLRRHSWPQGVVDIDTPADYGDLIEKKFVIPPVRQP